MSNHILVIFFVIFVFNQQLLVFSMRQRLYLVESIDMCPNISNLPVILYDQSVTRPAKNQFIINGKIRIEEVIPGPLTVTLAGHRCDSSDVCEHFQEFFFPRFCQQMNLKNIIWSPFMAQVDPQMSCPLQPGEYTLTNGTFDLTMLSGLPLEGYKWMVYMKVIAEQKVRGRKLVLCFLSRVFVTLGKKKSN